jgi:hypothetical protein
VTLPPGFAVTDSRCPPSGIQIQALQKAHGYWEKAKFEIISQKVRVIATLFGVFLGAKSLLTIFVAEDAGIWGPGKVDGVSMREKVGGTRGWYIPDRHCLRT